MKRIGVILVIVVILTLSIFKITSGEFFLSFINVKPVSTKPIQQSKKAETVRIVITDSNRTSIYHSLLELESDSLKIYYGKKYEDVKEKKELEVTKDSKYFKNSDVIKIESKNGIKWTKTYMDSTITYKGALYIYKENSGLVVVNQLELEDYVAGVIASEIGTDVPMEALKAQAICARTYINSSKSDEYEKYDADGDDTVSYQVYNKVSADKNCEQAARDTQGIIMLYKGKPITAYYFSTSCGYTTDYKIWGTKKQKYLKERFVGKKQADTNIREEKYFRRFINEQKEGYEKKCPFYRWSVQLSSEQIQNSLYRILGINVGDVSSIEVNKRGAGGIVSQITVYGKVRQIVLNNQNQIRKALCSYYSNIKLNDKSIRNKMDMLPSAFFYIDKQTDSQGDCEFVICGGGFGHGSGMSQNGAIEMAKKGKTYKQILEFFYTGITMKQK